MRSRRTECLQTFCTSNLTANSGPILSLLKSNNLQTKSLEVESLYVHSNGIFNGDVQTSALGVGTSSTPGDIELHGNLHAHANGTFAGNLQTQTLEIGSGVSPGNILLQGSLNAPGETSKVRAGGFVLNDTYLWSIAYKTPGVAISIVSESLQALTIEVVDQTNSNQYLSLDLNFPDQLFSDSSHTQSYNVIPLVSYDISNQGDAQGGLLLPPLVGVKNNLLSLLFGWNDSLSTAGAVQRPLTLHVHLALLTF